jgi:hypothetical protein
MDITSAVKPLEGWNAVVVGANNLRIHDRGYVDSHPFHKG